MLFHETQAFAFPPEDPRAFELPRLGILQLTFASNRPVLPPAWDEEHVQAVFQKATKAIRWRVGGWEGGGGWARPANSLLALVI